MTWSDPIRNRGDWFARMQGRFAHLDDSAMAFLKQERSRFEARLAATHDLTMDEAREELEDFLAVEALLREITGLHIRA